MPLEFFKKSGAAKRQREQRARNERGKKIEQTGKRIKKGAKEAEKAMKKGKEKIIEFLGKRKLIF